MSLSACSNHPVIETKTIYIYPEDTLLLSPCKETLSGEKLRTLSVAHVSNVDCIRSFEMKMTDIRQWKIDKLEQSSK